MAIDRADFAEECVRQGLFFGVSPHYLLGIAELMSTINDDTVDGEVGPYRVTQEVWDATRDPPEATTFEFSIRSKQINRPEIQCLYAGLMTFIAQEALRKELNRFPSINELYAKWPNDDTKKAGLKAALDSTADLVDPASVAVTGEVSPGMEVSDAAAMPKGAGGILGELIASGEGDYNSFNRGVAGDSKGKKINFADMTLTDAMAQQALPKGDPNRLFAIGKYQWVPQTMSDCVKALKIDKSSETHASAARIHVPQLSDREQASAGEGLHHQRNARFAWRCSTRPSAGICFRGRSSHG